jgi:hypothetical protein
MDTLALFSVPGIMTVLVTVALAAWIGHTIGRNNETRRKDQALADAERLSQETIEGLRAENQKKLDVLNKANSNQMEGLKQSHSERIDQLNAAHQTLVDSLKSGYATEIGRLGSEHSTLIDRLNSSNNANINELEQRRQAEITALRREQRQTLDALRGDHAKALQQLQDDRDRRIQEAEQRHADEMADLNDLLAEARIERSTLAAKNAELGNELTGLHDEIKEAKLNNRFSVSKSGEKLIRVVRSVQELASELDETSRTVTGGEYSFFDQIKDQRDRETVLSLAAGGQAFSGDAPDDTADHPGNGADGGEPLEDSVPAATHEARPAD